MLDIKTILKKPQYVRKYDFMRYFYRPKDEWFFSLDAINQLINSKLNQCYDLDNEENEEQSENDAYDFYREKLTDLNLKTLQTNSEFDPKMHEGNLVDQSAKEHIASLYSNFKVFDFDKLFPNNYNLEQLAKETIKILSDPSLSKIILFQPVFIARNEAIAKPDALVRDGNKLFLYEVKGTTRAKGVHLIDFIYQSNVISESLLSSKLGLYLEDYFLCLIATNLLNRNQVSFVCTNKLWPSKTGLNPKIDENILNQIGKIRAARLKFDSKTLKANEFVKLALNKKNTIKDFLNNQIDIYESKDDAIGTSKLRKNHTLDEDFQKNYGKIINNFWHYIEELFHYQPTYLVPKFEPNVIYKSFFKDNDYFLRLKEYFYHNENYPTTHFAGFIVKYLDQCQGYYDHISDIKSWINKFNNSSKAATRFLKYLNHDSKLIVTPECVLSRESIEKFFQLKTKKVYFDFESINLAVRIIDQIPPFLQIVNQVSIIFDHGNGINGELPINLVIDPLKIDRNSFKQIIDAIIPKKDPQNYSYVVYNKSFEVTRLCEMAAYINEPEYDNKVQIIIENIYDLADLFDPRKSSFIYFKELGGYYSIKKVLPLVEKYNESIFNEVKCQQYYKLTEIQNGSQAQNASSQRFFKLLDDNKWLATSNHLKQYCENDVRAMIAVEYLIKSIIKSVKV